LSYPRTQLIDTSTNRIIELLRFAFLCKVYQVGLFVLSRGREVKNANLIIVLYEKWQCCSVLCRLPRFLIKTETISSRCDGSSFGSGTLHTKSAAPWMRHDDMPSSGFGGGETLTRSGPIAALMTKEDWKSNPRHRDVVFGQRDEELNDRC
jgi:hypothetical protein